MNVHNKYIVYVGTVRGSIANSCCVPGQNAKFDLSQNQKGSEISTLRWGRDDNEILVGNRNGALITYNIAEATYGLRLSDLEGKGAVTGIAILDQTILVALRSGHVNLWQSKSCEHFSLDLDDKGTLDCMAQNKNNLQMVATGGVANDLKIWDIETKKCTFKAKSLGHDELNLPLPTSIRGLTFLTHNNLIACVTKEGNALLYDDRAQRKPISVLVEKLASYTTVATTCKPDVCVVGTTKGYMQVLDVRKPLKLLKTIKSFTGSITDIVCDNVKPVVASVSLDRYLRIHDLDTKELLYKEYLKHNLTSIIMRPIIKEETKEEISLEDQEYEELFDEMEVIDEKLEISPSLKRKDNKVSKLGKKKMRNVARAV